jgi:hypothetical protein
MGAHCGGGELAHGERRGSDGLPARSLERRGAWGGGVGAQRGGGWGCARRRERGWQRLTDAELRAAGCSRWGAGGRSAEGGGAPTGGLRREAADRGRLAGMELRVVEGCFCSCWWRWCSSPPMAFFWRRGHLVRQGDVREAATSNSDTASTLCLAWSTHEDDEHGSPGRSSPSSCPRSSCPSALVTEQRTSLIKTLAATTAATKGILKEIEDPRRDLHHRGVHRCASQCCASWPAWTTGEHSWSSSSPCLPMPGGPRSSVGSYRLAAERKRQGEADVRALLTFTISWFLWQKNHKGVSVFLQLI